MTKALFEGLITDEEGYIDFLETQIGLFDALGAQASGQSNSKPADQAQ